MIKCLNTTEKGMDLRACVFHGCESFPYFIFAFDLKLRHVRHIVCLIIHLMSSTLHPNFRKVLLVKKLAKFFASSLLSKSGNDRLFTTECNFRILPEDSWTSCVMEASLFYFSLKLYLSHISLKAILSSSFLDLTH